MRIRRRCDYHSLNVCIRERRLYVRGDGAEARRQPSGCGRIDIDDILQRRVAMGRDIRGMYLSDASRAEHAKIDGH
jgi:hypothetical protein